MDQNKSGFLSSIPLVTRNLIIINFLIWFAEFLLGRNGYDLGHYLGLHFFLSDSFMPHQLLTYMFLHDPNSITHVLFNMFAVFMFGRVLETIWGPKRFLIYYLITGIGAGLTQELVQVIQYNELIFGNIDMINLVSNAGTQIITKQEYFNMLPETVGASGAVFGILLAFGMLFPNTQLYIIPFPFPIKAKWFVIGYGLIELGLGFANVSGDNVAHFAHLGGLIFGLIIILYWKKKGELNGPYFK